MTLPTAQAFSEVLAWTLLHFFWQGLAIGALYAAAKQVSTSVRWQHAIALVGLFLLLLAPAITFCLLNLPAGAAGTLIDPAAMSVTPATAMPAIGVAMAGADGTADVWTLGLVGLWLLGSLVVGSRLVRDWREVRKAIRESAEPSLELLALLARQMERIGIVRKVRLRLTDRITTPAVYGFLRPVVLLPTALALGLPRDQLETLLAHELAHVRRADFVVNTLALIARTLFYFHPVVHWICRDLERTRETLCDDLVVELKVDRLKYARALSTVEHFRQKIPVPLLTAVGGELTSRVHRILAIETDNRQKKPRAPLLLSLAAIVVILAGVNGVTHEQLSAARPEFRVVYGALMGTPPAMEPPVVPVILQRALPQAIALAPLASDIAATAVATSLPAALPDIVDTAPATTIAPSTDADAPAPLLSADLPDLAAVTPPPQTMAMEAPAAAPDLPALDAPAAVPAVDDARQQAASAPRALRRVQPEYPRSALRHGTEGSVTLSYRLDARGVPVDVRVASSTPAHIFESASLDAFERWRFEAAAPTGERHSQTFSFSLTDSDDQRCIRVTGSGICRR